MATYEGGTVDDQTHRLNVPEVSVDGFGFSENSQWGLGDWALLDTTHQETAVYYRTNWDCTGASATPPREPRDIPIPMGHTDLYVEEKRLVVVDGIIRAVWPKTFEGGYTFRLIVAGANLREALAVGQGDSTQIRDVANDAVRLSELTSRPVVVARQLSRHGWH